MRARLIGLLLVLGTLLLYLPAWHYPFVSFDDSDYVGENAMVQAGLTWAGFKWAWTTWHASNWHPLTWLSYMLDCQFFGLNAGMHHGVNVLFHAANAVLLLALVWRWTGRLWTGAFVAALFAWHPMHVESVAWISERKDVLSAFFGLLALLAYTRFGEASKGQNPKSKVFCGLALLAFALGLLAKPMLVTLPFVLLLLDYWPLNRIRNSEFGIRSFARLLLEKWPFFALAAASCAMTFLAQHHGGAVASLETVPLHYRLKNLPVAYATYLFKLFWPAHLAVYYPLPDRIPPAAIGGAAAMLIFISAAVWLGRRPAPYGLTGWLWFLGTLVPVIGLVQVGGAALADRYSYLPSIGIFLAAALGANAVAEKIKCPKILLASAGSAALAACALLTHRQLNYWRDSIALFSHTIAVTKDNYTAHINLGYAYEKEGRQADAMAEYRTALNLDPDSAEALNNLANLLADTGHKDEALAEYQAALRSNPRNIPAHNNLGTLLVEAGRFDEAMRLYAEAGRLDPDDWHAPFLMGKALLKQGRDAEAVPFFRQAVQLAPENLNVLVFVAQVLASDENSQVRDGRAAILLAQKANDLTGGIQPAMLDTLAMAYAELGRFDDAQNAAQDALNIAKQAGATNDITMIQQRLDFYQKDQPFRQSFTNAPGGQLPKQ